MPYNPESVSLAPHLTLVVHWSARVADFIKEWQQRQMLAPTTHPLDFWAEAASTALSDVQQGPHRALDVLADLYHGSQLLPTPGDLLFIGALTLKVDQRHFVTQRVGGVLRTEVQYYLGVEAYRYANTTLPILAAN
ncbi:hypothetical protein [Hymenobacter bucti]|uniref:hypothetical protein n=1 Tax=Hymenobacter bucti TaxID=1844114 RepID=UPI0036D327ED